RCAWPSANVTVPPASDAKSMPASAVPLTAFQLTPTRPDKGCERLIRNTAATELSLVTMLSDSNEISLIGAAAAGRGLAIAGAATEGSAVTGASSDCSGAEAVASASGAAAACGTGVGGNEA